MLRRHIVLLIAIRSSDGDIKPRGPLGAPGFTFTLPFIIIPITQLHYRNSYTYSHPNLNSLQYTLQILHT